VGSGGLLGPLEGGLVEGDEVGFLGSFNEGGFSGGGGEESDISMISGALDVDALGLVVWKRGREGVSIETTQSE